MADDSADQVSQNAIPPKAVPPQAAGAGDNPTVRRQVVPQPGGGSAPIPRTVRLKPIGSSSSSPAPTALPTVSVPQAARTEDAAETIKRMTARINMMPSEGETQGAKKSTGRVPAGAESGQNTGAFVAGGNLEGSVVQKVSSRIQMSNTSIIPDIGDTPKTIKIRPNASTQPLAESGAARMPSQQAAGKAKTSRIPLESAMSLPSGAAAQQAASADGAPKTIKLKRPGEMSTIKVSVAGVGATHAAATEPAHEESVTQKRTIRVKRPTVAVASVDAGGASGDPTISMTPVPLPAAPERGLGWFIAVAAVCILVGIGVTVVVSLQLFGSRPHTELDLQFQQG